MSRFSWRTPLEHVSLSLVRSLRLQSDATVSLAHHIYKRVAPALVQGYRLATLAHDSKVMMILGVSMWTAAKLEENRRGLATASELCSVMGFGSSMDVAALELDVLQCVDWNPYLAWAKA